MKIGQQPDTTPALTQATQSVQAKSADLTPALVPKNERKSASVGVTVSSSVRTMEQARSADAADVDLEKVNAMRQAIEQKTFVANPESIADKLLANAREMLGRTRS